MNFAKQALNMAASLGKEAMSARFPNEFEFYMVALELTDSKNKTIDYLSFPILPDSISKTEPNKNNILQSMSGVTVLSSPTFTPQQITISGSFGYGFKLLLETKYPVGKQATLSTNAGKYSLYSISKEKGLKSLTLSGNMFNAGVKTGYGLIKILQAIVNKSVGLDDEGQPLRTFFYNMAFGESYLVAIDPNGIRFFQDLSHNMIWHYDLTMTAVAPIEAVRPGGNGKSFMGNLLRSGIQKGVSQFASSLTKGILG